MVDEGRLPYGFGVSQQLLVILTEVDLCEFYSRYPDREPSSINREPLIALWQLNVYDRYLPGMCVERDEITYKESKKHSTFQL